MTKRVVLLVFTLALLVCRRAPVPVRVPAPTPALVNPYLHARLLIARNQHAAAAKELAPFLAPGNPFRDLALYHQAEIDDALGAHDAASRDRQALIFEFPSAFYRDRAIDDEVKYLMRDPRRLAAFAQRIPSRDVQARLAEASRNVALALSILAGGTADDAAEHAARALDRPESLTPPQKLLLGTAMLNHRHFDRAVAVLSSLPYSDDTTFAIGRAFYGDEKFAQAQATYLRGARATKNAAMKATFLWHAARSAQLQGNDRAAEQLMTQAIAQPARTAATSAALTQRLRTRIKQRRFAAAAADLNAVRKLFPKDHAVVEASLAYAVGMFGAGNRGACVVTLNAIPRNLLDKLDPYEIDYWRARALESSNPRAARDAYLRVAQATEPTHFAYFARQRLHFQPDLARLAASYRAKPAYAAVLDLKPLPFPHFPLPPNASRAEVLMALGLFDEAAGEIPKIWPLHPMSSGLTQSLALNRGNAGRESIHAIEEVMKSVPADYVPQLLPRLVRELLYPRFFDSEIRAESTDPTLVLAIMREESRFDRRAKSKAAARGLLQIIITTARQIDGSVDEDDLYDPRVIIRLGTTYIATLSKQLGGDRYKIAAAYNAGPHQTALWSRLAAGPGDDFFLTAVSFDETKDYVRKVMNSYENYAELATRNRS